MCPDPVHYPDDSSSFFLIGNARPFELDDNGQLVQRILTFFIRHRVIVSANGIHSTQRLDYIGYLNKRREADHKPKLTRIEENTILGDSVSIVTLYDEEDGEPFLGIRSEGDLDRAERGVKALLEIFPANKVRLI